MDSSQKSPPIASKFVCFVAVATSMLAMTMWLASQEQTKQASLLLDKIKVKTDPLDYIKCRQNFLRQLDQANIIFSDEQEPVPVSMFVKHQDLYIVVLGRQRLAPGKNNSNAAEKRRCHRGLQRTRKWVTWMETGRLVASWESGSANCSFIEPTVAATREKEVSVYKCPLMADGLSAQIFSLSMSRGSKVTKLGEGFRSCQLPLQKPKFRLVACMLVADYHMDRLPEWIEYHSLVGFEHFFIFVNSGKFSNYHRMLKIYVDDLKIVTLSPCHSEDYGRLVADFFTQPAVYQDCLYRLKGRVDWIAIFDADEHFRLLPGNRYNTTKWPDFLDAYYADLKARKPNASIPGLTCLSWNYAFPPAVKADPCFEHGFYSRITTMTYRESEPSLKSAVKEFIRVDDAVYAYIHWAYTADGTISYGHPEDFVNKNDGFLVHFRPSYLPDLKNAIRSNHLHEDTSYSLEAAESVFRQLKNHGFNEYRRQKNCTNGTLIRKSLYADGCMSNNPGFWGWRS